jgi:hypothetical protein
MKGVCDPPSLDFFRLSQRHSCYVTVTRSRTYRCCKFRPECCLLLLPSIRLPKPLNCKVIDNMMYSEKHIFHVYIWTFLNVTFSKHKKTKNKVLTAFLVSHSVVRCKPFLLPRFHLITDKRVSSETFISTC